MAQSSRPAEPTAWSSALATVNKHWAGALAGRRLHARSGARYSQMLETFRRYAEANGIASPAEVELADCESFARAPLRSGAVPQSATCALRLTVIRSAFDVLVSEGLVPENPAAGLRVRREPVARGLVPLTLPEVRRLTAAVRVTPGTAAWPAVTALALLGAAHAEVATAVVADFDEDAASLRLGEGPASRIVTVPPAVCDVLVRRIEGQRRRWRQQHRPWVPADVPLALARPVDTYPVNSVAPTVGQNLARALHQAGIVRAGVYPKSLRVYAANARYAQTRRVEAVAEYLGIVSFDGAARLIDRDWQQRWGDAIRAGAVACD